MTWRNLLVPALVFALPAPVLAAAGSLLIVGGGLDPGNAPIHHALLAARPADAPTIAIIPAASGYPADSARRFAETLIRHGARAQDIVVVHLAAEDDPTTTDVDESSWAPNAGSEGEIARLEKAGAIWFTGGDQLRITRLLRDDAGQDSPMLAAIRTRLAEGAVVGGSSAGAAIMSRTMITSGESLVALIRPVRWQAVPDNRDEAGTLVLADGLGFLTMGLVDQHFDARARLGRLARALFQLPVDQRVGLGIDEDTALHIRLDTGQAEALGSGQVTVLDARMSQSRQAPDFAASRIRLSILSAGDRLALEPLSVMPAAGRMPVSAVADAPALPDAGGFALPPERTGRLLLDGLMQRMRQGVLERTSFQGHDRVRYRFERVADSRAASGANALGQPGITISNVVMAIDTGVALQPGRSQ